MKSSFDQQLQQRFQRYRKLSEEGASLSAITRLAEIFNCLLVCQKISKSTGLDAFWTQHLQRERELADVKAGVCKQADRIRKILSVGNEWQDEEILLVQQMSFH